MKERKIMVTIEILTNIRLKDFDKLSMQEMFNQYFIDGDEALIIHQVKSQVVKPEK